MHSKPAAETGIDPGSLPRAKHFMHHSELSKMNNVCGSHLFSHRLDPDAVVVLPSQTLRELQFSVSSYGH